MKPGTTPRRPAASTNSPPPDASAKAAGLRYVTDAAPGFRRLRAGPGFRYLDQRGRALRDPAVLRRIAALAIPPAWREVWICPYENGHLQATGRDARGRKQHRYHPRWRETRDETKYNRMLAFARALPKIRQRVRADLNARRLSREKVLATVVQLLEKSLIRVGNDEYARDNHSYGLTTLRDQHVDVNGATIRFQFKGKSGRTHTIDVRDRRLARVVKSCQDLPGQELFQYLDAEGQVHDVGSSDVNEYLREIGGSDFTAKDFRTWAGTVLAALALQEFNQFDSQTQAKKNLLRAIEAVAKCLGNTPAICRKCYIHPAILDSYLDGSMIDTLRQRAENRLIASLPSLRPEEASVLSFLQRRLAQEKKGPGPSIRQQLRQSLRLKRRKTR